MKIEITLIIIALMLFSCKSKKVTTDIQKKDSIVYVKETIHDTIIKSVVKEIFTPYETFVEIPIECDSMGLLKQFEYAFNGKYQNTKVSASNGVIRIDNSQKEYYNLLEKEYRSLQKDYDSISNVKSKVIYKEKEVIKKTFWQRLINNLWFVLFLIVAILWVFGLTPRYIFLKFFV